MDADIIDLAMDSSFSQKSVNFGSGIELLMNDKPKKESNGSSNDIHLEDLNRLEDELNDLSADINSGNNQFFEGKSNFFSKQEKPSVSFSEEADNIGKATAETNSDSKTWDGYGKFNNIPMNPDKAPPSGPQMGKDETLREKFKYLRKLEALENKGVNLTKKYNMDSNLAEMQGEYEMIMEEKTRQNSVKFQGNMLMACINGIEFLNDRFDPFDVKLDGWSEQVNENMTDYDDIFGELYDKYKSRASMAPELKLLFQLGGSAMMVHMTNTMFKSAMPGMDDILRQNPDLMRQFQTAAVNSMGQSSPGLSGFMNNMMGQDSSRQDSSRQDLSRQDLSRQDSSRQDSQGPPPPIQTQGPNAPDYSINRGGNNNFGMGRNMNDGINIREMNRTETNRTSRPEMKGPSDISDILSGLKTKTINIQEASSDNNNSTISISDLKELQAESINIPKKSKRRQKSDKNTVSLDI